MKGSPLLRAWLAELAGLGVVLRNRWRWLGFSGEDFRFETPEGERLIRPKVTILALGGASWSRLGSDGAWAPWLAAKGVQIAPFKPTNMGFEVAWSAHMQRHFGSLLKEFVLRAGGMESRGEIVISARGIEGGGLYALSRPLDEAISTAGGVTRAALSADLELTELPRVFVAGEMLDWEAPTGGYLLTACLATGRWAGRGSARDGGASRRDRWSGDVPRSGISLPAPMSGNGSG